MKNIDERIKEIKKNYNSELFISNTLAVLKYELDKKAEKCK